MVVINLLQQIGWGRHRQLIILSGKSNESSTAD